MSAKLAIVLHLYHGGNHNKEDYNKILNESLVPLITIIKENQKLATGLHLTGQFIEWMENEKPELIKEISELSFNKQIEIIGGGWQHPQLSFLPLHDITGQLRMMKIACAKAFGVIPYGVWLSDLHWDQTFPFLLSVTGYQYAIVDEELLTERQKNDHPLCGYFISEKFGRTIKLLPISRFLKREFLSGRIDLAIATIKSNPETIWVYGENISRLIFESNSGSGFSLKTFFSAISKETQNAQLETICPSSIFKIFPSSGIVDIKMTGPEHKGKLLWNRLCSQSEEFYYMHRRMVDVSNKIINRENTEIKKIGAPSGEIIAARKLLYRSQGNITDIENNIESPLLPQICHEFYRNLIQAENLIEQSDSALKIEEVKIGNTEEKSFLITTREMRVIVEPGRGGGLTEIDMKRKKINTTAVIYPANKELKSCNVFDELNQRGRYVFQELLLPKNCDLKEIFSGESLRSSEVIANISTQKFDIINSLIKNDKAMIEMKTTLEIENNPLNFFKTVTVNPFASAIGANYNIKWEGEKSLEVICVVLINFSLIPSISKQESNRKNSLWQISIINQNEKTPEFSIAEEKKLFPLTTSFNGIAIAETDDCEIKIPLQIKYAPPCNFSFYNIKYPAKIRNETINTISGFCFLSGWEMYLENWNEWKGSIELTIKT